MPILVYSDEDISFKYNENWTKKYKSNDYFSIFARYNNLSEKTILDISKIPINYNKGENHTNNDYKKYTERYILNTFDSEIIKTKKITIANLEAWDIWTKRNFEDMEIEERFIGFIKNQYIYQFKIVTDKNLNLLTDDIEVILNSFTIINKTHNPPNRFNKSEINEILEKSKLSDQKAVLKILKNLLKVILILLSLLLIFLIIGILIK
ncbi:hypothetical protein SDC9_07597 [bioreactor metagenome]|mgnify:CR=1 FL=1|uniref:Uncharacterized protein n=1 Tax=bioreactor metagenome TaxID=1076179 RepID=A0A644T681_9ZZZZ|nr:hypothetical protein [Methanobrevibacter sp.]MEA4957802.1 hypothetical protein [Methanobrevibacter sp.]